MQRNDFLKKNSTLFDSINRLIDILIIIVSGLGVYIYEFGVIAKVNHHYLTCILLSALLTTIIFHNFNLYHSWRGTTLINEYKIIVLALLLQWTILLSILFLLNLNSIYSKQWLILWFITELVLLLLYRFFIRSILAYYRNHNFNLRSVCIITDGNYGQIVFKNIILNKRFGFRIGAVFSDITKDNNIYGNKLMGNIDDSLDWLKTNEVDQLWIIISLDKIDLVKTIIHSMRHSTVDIRLIPDLNSFNLLNHSISEIAGIPFINLSMSPMRINYHKFMKRIEDIICATVILILLLPIITVIYIAIKLSFSGPVIYKQRRVGLNNKEFTMLKFRSMPVDVESKTGPVWAKKDDQRTTSFGHFIRKTSLDEVPQFINVLKGEMSIVGPRPERPELIAVLKERVPLYSKKHLVKAGITGWAQVNGWRGNTDLYKRIEYDIYYIENWSILFDLKIILLTITKGIFHKNAY